MSDVPAAFDPVPLKWATSNTIIADWLAIYKQFEPVIPHYAFA